MSTINTTGKPVTMAATSSAMLDWESETSVSISDELDEDYQMFVNLSRKEVIIYPTKVGKNGIIDMDSLRTEQLAVRKAFCEFMLPSRLRAFPKARVKPNYVRKRERRRELWDLPDEALVRVIDYLPAATVLLFASLSSLCLNLAAFRIEKILWPEHLGRWAGGAIEFVEIWLKDVCINEEVATPGNSELGPEIGNQVQLAAQYHDYEILKIPRGIYGDQDGLEATQALWQVLSLGGKNGGIPYQLSWFAGYAYRGEEIYLSFHEDQRYFFCDTSGDLTEFNHNQYFSTAGSGDPGSNDTPHRIFHANKWIFGSHYISRASNWAGRTVRLGPLGTDSRKTMQFCLVDGWLEWAAMKRDLTSLDDVEDSSKNDLEALALRNPQIVENAEEMMLVPVDDENENGQKDGKHEVGDRGTDLKGPVLQGEQAAARYRTALVRESIEHMAAIGYHIGMQKVNNKELSYRKKVPEKRAVTSTEALQQLLASNIIHQRFSITSLGQRQQVCTQPQTPVFTTEGADEKGVLPVIIDAAKSVKDRISQCSSCDNIGDAIAQAVHGGCVELFRIHSNQNAPGNRRIETLELDLRPSKDVTSNNSNSKEPQSDRMELLEARMRGSEQSTPSSSPTSSRSTSNQDAQRSETQRIIKAMANRWEESLAKRRRVTEDDDASLSSEDTDETEKASSPKRSRSAKKKKKAAIKIAKLFSPIQAITIYDPPTDTDPTLRNPRAAWAQTIPQSLANELTITQRSSGVLLNQSESSNRISTIYDSATPSWMRVHDDREGRLENGHSELYNAGRPNALILRSMEDEKASPHHRTEGEGLSAFQLQELSDCPNPFGSRLLAESNDGYDVSPSAASTSMSGRSQYRAVKKERAILLNRESVESRQSRMEESVTARIRALKLDDNVNNLHEEFDVEPTIDVLRKDESLVTARIEMLRNLQQTKEEEDQDFDELMEPDISDFSAMIERAFQRTGSVTLENADERFRAHVQRAFSYPDIPPPELTEDSFSDPLQVESSLCYQPTEIERLKLFRDLGSSSSSATVSRSSSAFEEESCRPQQPPDSEVNQSSLSRSPAGGPSRSNALGNNPTSPASLGAFESHVRTPPGFKSHIRDQKTIEASQKRELNSPTQISINPPEVGKEHVAPLAHPELSLEDSGNKPSIERLGDAIRDAVVGELHVLHESKEDDKKSHRLDDAITSSCSNAEVSMPSATERAVELDENRDDEEIKAKSVPEAISHVHSAPPAMNAADSSEPSRTHPAAKAPATRMQQSWEFKPPSAPFTLQTWASIKVGVDVPDPDEERIRDFRFPIAKPPPPPPTNVAAEEEDESLLPATTERFFGRMPFPELADKFLQAPLVHPSKMTMPFRPQRPDEQPNFVGPEETGYYYTTPWGIDLSRKPYSLLATPGRKYYDSDDEKEPETAPTYELEEMTEEMKNWEPFCEEECLKMEETLVKAWNRKPLGDGASDSADEPRDEFAVDSANEAGDELTADSAYEAGDKFAADSADEAGDELAADSADESGNEPAADGVNGPADELAADGANEARDDLAADSADEAGDEAGDETGDELATDNADESGDEAVAESADEPRDEPVDAMEDLWKDWQKFDPKYFFPEGEYKEPETNGTTKKTENDLPSDSDDWEDEDTDEDHLEAPKPNHQSFLNLAKISQYKSGTPKTQQSNPQADLVSRILILPSTLVVVSYLKRRKPRQPIKVHRRQNNQVIITQPFLRNPGRCAECKANKTSQNKEGQEPPKEPEERKIKPMPRPRKKPVVSGSDSESSSQASPRSEAKIEQAKKQNRKTKKPSKILKSTSYDPQPPLQKATAATQPTAGEETKPQADIDMEKRLAPIRAAEAHYRKEYKIAKDIADLDTQKQAVLKQRKEERKAAQASGKTIKDEASCTTSVFQNKPMDTSTLTNRGRPVTMGGVKPSEGVDVQYRIRPGMTKAQIAKCQAAKEAATADPPVATETPKPKEAVVQKPANSQSSKPVKTPKEAQPSKPAKNPESQPAKTAPQKQPPKVGPSDSTKEEPSNPSRKTKLPHTIRKNPARDNRFCEQNSEDCTDICCMHKLSLPRSQVLEIKRIVDAKGSYMWTVLMTYFSHGEYGNLGQEAKEGMVASLLTRMDRTGLNIREADEAGLLQMVKVYLRNILTL
ncbi:hypothetical protein Dda_6358 [Drechslerella dactyloides]|uniref:F-box domain-containing protein n=1 Tax=Drechslerella dactyloides TaxID=74499 RepID=A0AAD6ITD6_DREDA|nr:hypothetical protein Dda_6358 [Drechslerella dactyloides]